MSLFKKPKKIAQRRIFTSEDGENNDNDELTTTDNKDKKKDKREKEKPKKPSLLSFGDEGTLVLYDLTPLLSLSLFPSPL